MSMGANLKATEAIGRSSWAPTEPSGQVLTKAGTVSINKALSASVLTTPAETVPHSVSQITPLTQLFKTLIHYSPFPDLVLSTH